MSKLRVLDLFSGIGGFSLGLERTGGFETVAFCEIAPFPRKVLKKHWPHVPCYEDVRTLTAERLAADGISVDVICGGFPCQDISFAGKGAGLEGERSGLWSEIARLAGELRPRFIIVENVSALLSRGLDRVLGDLAEVGFDAEWHCIPASALGAPHRRDRFWMVAYADGGGAHAKQINLSWGARSTEFDWHGPSGPLANATSKIGTGLPSRTAAKKSVLSCGSRHVAHAERLGCRQMEQSIISGSEGERPANQAFHSDKSRGGGWWATEPDVGRVAHGVPSRVDRLRALGNAVVPQIPELIGNAILRSMKEAA